MENETNSLISDLLKQKRAAQERLLVLYGEMVFRLVARIVPQREDAEEVYQDVFVKAFRGIGTYDGRQASLATWLGRIAYHEALNFVRRKAPAFVYFDEYPKDLEDCDEEADAQHDEHAIQRMEQSDEKPKRRIWLYAASAVAASVLILLLFRSVQDTAEAPVVAAQQAVQTEVKQPQEVLAQPTAMVVKEASPATPQRKSPVRKARRSQPIEERDTLPAQTEEPDMEQEFVDPALIYSLMMGDPILASMEHVRDIRARGERLQQEVELALNRSMQSFNH